ncbi:DUF3293 domain-containing protein [Pseudoxanthomonas sp.]|uniref:DUF3293 domain-containing protein n=1 Tax=Pseudoxanthomonas sp. TaxID=1871049 RepID=UPI0026194A4A|nr:DUF3293 domain-containing protein [Pseudoxanthomonas sp.]WDS36551.1 MAG: DUF3293 domain-containing protein [Pseudoxanthomonas sp.]
MKGETEPRELPVGQLARLYAAAHYFVLVGRQEWLFQVGQRAQDVERQLGAARYQFVTAWNPHSRPAGESRNLEAGDALESRLLALGCTFHRALGCNAQGGAIEHGWLVLDTKAAQADALAREFGQAGTLYWQAGEPVRLRMQHAQPQDCCDNPFIDWIA